MNPLESLKEKLKQKPIVQQNNGVKVKLAQDKKRPVITQEKDDGTIAKEVLEKIRRKKLSAVIQKFPEPKEEIVAKMPDIPEEKIKKAKKLPKSFVVLKEEVKPLPEELPEGGPQMEEPELKEPELKEEKLIEEENQQIVAEAQPTIIKKRITKKVNKNIIPLGNEAMIQIGDTPLAKRLPPLPVFNVNVSSYYMNNREIFVNFINSIFEPYKNDLLDETKGISCEDIGKDTGEISLLTHQKIVKDYMNLYTPYRGLLLYHGLGSGKTCTSIAIAEGMKSERKVIVMTPASLKRNYMEEIKKCGDLLFRKNQYWEWIPTDDNPQLIMALSKALGLPEKYISRHHGAWLVNITKQTNYTDLDAREKKILNDQLDAMIENKYTFYNYNGLTRSRFAELTNNFETNIFDNAVVIIDEAHNFISRIVNKINKMTKFASRIKGSEGKLSPHLAIILYEFLLRAENCRVVLLTGTPIINYPNEIGILFNILRGYIKTWNLTLDISKLSGFTRNNLKKIFENEKILDYVDYVPSSKLLTITRNPFGFENKITKNSGYRGVTNEKKEKRNKAGEVERDESGNKIYEDRGRTSDKEFIEKIVKLLKNNDITVVDKGTSLVVQTALPDTLEEFIIMFINKDNGSVVNVDKFKRRIIGLTSYFRSAQEELLPRYDKEVNRHVVKIPMSDYQFQVYENYRIEERKNEKNSRKNSQVITNEILKDPSSTYRIFSRLACNFAMPMPPGRPNPSQYRTMEASNIRNKILGWVKDTYFEDKPDIDEDFKQKYDAFMAELSSDFIRQNEKNIKSMLGLYIKEYNKNNRQSIKEFAIKIGIDIKETLNVKEAKILDLLKAEEKEIKEKEKPIKEKNEEEKQKDKEKAIAKAEKDRVKAEKEKAKEDKALEKERAKAEKERVKAEKEKEADENKRMIEEEKETKKRLKEEEKERARIQKAEEKERLKREKKENKKMVAGDKDLETDSDDSVIDDSVIDDSYLDDEYSGGSKTGDINNFVENLDDNNLLAAELNDIKDEDARLRENDELEGDELLATMGSQKYMDAIASAVKYLRLNSQKYLSLDGLQTYSPKFLAMIENINDPEHVGLHLIYSQFRSMEGIGIFSMALDANGYAEFKIKRDAVNGWQIDMSEEDIGKPCYALYTGTEDAEEREIIRNIYNGTWNYIPNNIATQLRNRSSNNNLGEIIKILMITSAGSEGINLRNTRYVHIMEPYWHPVRLEQVVGRARRICSHQSLPKEMQTVEVFIYIMTFTDKQLESENAKELKLQDVSKNPPYVPQSSDEKLFEILSIKEQLTSQLLKAIKESSIDCATHIRSSEKEGLACLSFGNPDRSDFSYNPSIFQDQNDTIANMNRVGEEWDAKVVVYKPTGKKYIRRMDTDQLYDYDSVMQARRIPGVQPRLIGKLVKRDGKYEIVIDNI